MGFLRLSGYYRRFIKNYGKLAKPLKSLLKKKAFKWDELATDAFEKLKKVMTISHVLALPNFDNLFKVDSDASGNVVGVVLTQEGRPVAYFSKDYLHNIRTYPSMKKR